MPNWLDRLLGRDRKTGALPQQSASDGARLLEILNGKTPGELYCSQPALRAVVSFLAREIASVPLKVYTAEDDGSDRRRDRTSPAALLLARPNGHQTLYELMEQTVTDLKLYGDALWIVAEDADSPSGWRIEAIPTAWVRNRYTMDGFSAHSFKIHNPTIPGGRTVIVPAEWCIRFGGYRPGSPTGAASPVDALKQILAEQVSALQFRNQVWRNGGRITSYLTRPMGAEWSPEARDRFLTEWHDHGGDKGSRAGSTPLFEDGIELKTVPFNARETEWAAATTLSRQDVAGVYHVNPSMVWSNDGQTYASAKENARSLYVDTLGPDLAMISDKITAALLPMVGAGQNAYAEFDIQSKLAGSFEEQAAQLQTAVGGPYMSRAEARDRMNLPYIEGTDELIVPLNVITGGLASPTDTDTSMLSFVPAVRKSTPAPARKSRGRPSATDAEEMAEVFERHFKRQEKAVLSIIDRDTDKDGRKRVKADGDPVWWDRERWNRELASDLEPVLMKQASRAGRRGMRELGFDADDYDEGRTEAYLRAMARGRAEAVNGVTLRELRKTLDGDVPEDALGATPKGVFEKAVKSRAAQSGSSLATSASSWAVMEAGRQSGHPRSKITKTWNVTSSNPRPSHSAMDGETVPIDESFSNGGDWPGDTRSLGPDETCGCCCDVTIEIVS